MTRNRAGDKYVAAFCVLWLLLWLGYWAVRR